MVEERKTNGKKGSSGLEGAKEDAKTAFVATPIGPLNSEIRRATDGLLSSVIKPTLREFGFDSVVSHEESDQGSISQRMIEHLLYDELVVVNLTGLNANVMYELGIRHSTGKPVLLICENNTDLPFDMHDLRTIFYTNDMQGVIDLKSSLYAALNDPDVYSSNKYNPVMAKAKDNLVEAAIKEMDFGKIYEKSITADLYESVTNMSSSLSHMSRRLERIEANNTVVRNNQTYQLYKNKGLLSKAMEKELKIPVSNKNDFTKKAKILDVFDIKYEISNDGNFIKFFDTDSYFLAKDVILNKSNKTNEDG